MTELHKPNIPRLIMMVQKQLDKQLPDGVITQEYKKNLQFLTKTTYIPIEFTLDSVTEAFLTQISNREETAHN